MPDSVIFLLAALVAFGLVFGYLGWEVRHAWEQPVCEGCEGAGCDGCDQLGWTAPEVNR